MIRVTCVCGKALTYLPEFAGKRVRCPKCQKPVQVPADEKKPSIRTCPAHPDHRAVGTCTQCGASICSECRGLFGYYCSEGCRATTEQVRGDPPAPAPPRAPDRSVAILKALKWSVLGVAVLLLGAGAYWLIRVLTDHGGEVAWTADLDGRFASDLFVCGDSLYLVCGNGTITRYDPDTGEKRGEVSIAGGYANVSGRDGEVLIVHSMEGLLGVHLGDGAVLWTLEHAVLWPESIAAGHLCASLPEELVCVDVRTGAKRWSRPYGFDRWIHGAIAHGGRVLVLLREEIALLRAESGEELWTAPAPMANVHLTEAGILCVTDRLRLLRYEDGSVVWELPLGSTGEALSRHLKIQEGRLFVLGATQLSCLSLATGEILWNALAPTLPTSLELGPDGGFVSGFDGEDLLPKLDDPLLPIAGREILRDVVRQELGGLERMKPFLYAFDLETGKIRWKKMNAGGQCRIEGEALLVWGPISAMNLLDPTKRFVTREAIRLLDADDGDVRWEFETDSIATPIVVRGEKLYYARSQHGANVSGASEPVEPRAVESQLVAVHME